MKKLTKVLLAVTAMCAVLTGCFGNEQQEVNPNVQNQGGQNNNSVVQNQGNQGNQGAQNNNEQQKEQEEEKIVSEPVNTSFEESEIANSMKALNTTAKFVQLSEAEIEEKYQFGKYKGLEKIVVSEETDAGISEIVIVKLGDMEQSADILLKFVDRLNNLKEKYAENQEVLDMLNTQDSFIIKQQAGVAVMILGPNAKAMEAEFDKAFQ